MLSSTSVVDLCLMFTWWRYKVSIPRDLFLLEGYSWTKFWFQGWEITTSNWPKTVFCELFQTNVYITITHARRNVAFTSTTIDDQLLTVVMPKGMTLPVVRCDKVKCRTNCSGKNAALPSIRPVASTWGRWMCHVTSERSSFFILQGMYTQCSEATFTMQM